MQKLLFLMAAAALSFGGLTFAPPAFADDLADCENLGDARIAPISTDVPDNVKALIGGWDGEWNLEGSPATPDPSSVVFTGVREGKLVGVYVFKGVQQGPPKHFDIDGENSVSLVQGAVKFTFSFNGTVLLGKRTQGNFKANTNMHPCKLP
jgi:hypothetical protein